MFEADINLDDVDEALSFLQAADGKEIAAIARELGFEGTGAFDAARALLIYAQRYIVAHRYRELGKIAQASIIEIEMDDIYNERIRPNITCW